MAVVYDFRENPMALKRWSDMDQFNKLKQLGLVPDLGSAESDTEWVLNRMFGIADTSPCEYSAPDNKEPA